MRPLQPYWRQATKACPEVDGSTLVHVHCREYERERMFVAARPWLDPSAWDAPVTFDPDLRQYIAQIETQMVTSLLPQ